VKFGPYSMDLYVVIVLAAGNKYPKMNVLICNFHWSRSQKYTKNLQLHIRVLHACREYVVVEEVEVEEVDQGILGIGNRLSSDGVYSVGLGTCRVGALCNLHVCSILQSRYMYYNYMYVL
jgi:hypothetical protein